MLSAHLIKYYEQVARTCTVIVIRYHTYIKYRISYFLQLNFNFFPEDLLRINFDYLNRPKVLKGASNRCFEMYAFFLGFLELK